MRSGLVWVIVVLAIGGAAYLFTQDDGGGDPHTTPVDDGPEGEPAPKETSPELMGSGADRPHIPVTMRGRGILQGMAQVAGAGVPAEVELRHVVEIDPKAPFKGGLERMFIERMLDSGISGKDPIGRTSAGADGRFKFKGLAPGLYEVRATVASGAMGFASGMLPAHGARIEVNVDIPDGDQTLKGRVLYANDKPYKGMVVAAAGESFGAMMMGAAQRVRPTFSDDEGRFTLTGLPKGRYQISAIIPGQMRAMGAPIAVPHDGEYVLKILVGGVTVKGKVIAAATEEPIAGANVFGGGGDPSSSFAIATTRSEADGTFEMTIPSGRGGGMFVRAAGYAPQMVQFRNKIDESVVVTMLALGSVRGQVTTKDGGTPQAGVTVTATPQVGRGMGFGGSMQTAVTDADGRYTIEGVQPGPVKLHALGGGWASVGLSGMGFGETQTPYVVELEPGGSAEKDLEILPSGKVTGRVLTADGRPVPGAVVQVGTGNDIRGIITAMMGLGITFGSDVTDGDGVYTIDAIVPGTQYKLAVKAPEHPDAESKSFTGESGKTETIDITFPKSRWLDVYTVAKEGNTPLAGASVYVQPKRADGGRIRIEGFFGPGKAWVTDSEGHARVGPLPEGELQVAVRAPGYIEADQDVGADQEGKITLEVQKGLVIAGRIELPPGVPAQSIRVRVERDRHAEGEWFWERATVDAAGRFHIDTIKVPGEYKVSGRGQWEDRAFKGEIHVDAGTTDVVLELQEDETEKRESLEVTVLDANGKLVPSGSVQLYTQSRDGRSSGSSGTRLSNGKALLGSVDADAQELYIEVYGLVGDRGATIQGPVVPKDGKLEVRLPRPEVIAGTVTGPDGKGVVGVRVLALPVHPRNDDQTGQMHGESVSDGDGRFEIKSLGPLEYKLRVRPTGNYAPTPDLTTQAGERKVAITLREGARAVITLIDYAGKPVAGARAHVHQPRSESNEVYLDGPFISQGLPTSDGDGKLRLKGLEPNAKFTVRIDPPNARSEELRQIKLERWTPQDETLTFARAYTIEGTIRTTDDEIPKGASIRHRKAGTESWSWGGRVKPDGTFKVTGLENERYELRAEGSGHYRHVGPTPPGQTPAPETRIVTARAGAKGVKLVVDLGGKLTIKIRGLSRNEHRYRNAQLVTEEGQSRSYLHGNWTRHDTVEFTGLKKDATYRLWIGGLAGGKYVEKDGLRAQAGSVTVEAQQGGTIEGTVKWPAGAGEMRHVNVTANRPGATGVGANVDMKTGRFKLEGLPEGEWTVSAYAWSRSEGRMMWRGQATARLGADIEIVMKAQKTGPGR